MPAKCRSMDLYMKSTRTRALSAPCLDFWDATFGDQHLLPLEQGIRKMTSLPAQRERLPDRGLPKEGYFADITLLDPITH